MSSRIEELQHRVDDDIELMRINFVRFAEREDNYVKELEMRTLRLESQEEQFHVQTIELDRKMTMKVWLWKWKLMWFVIIAVFILLIVIVFATSLHNK